ncbi:putative procollagen-lysine [Moumouvirus australiensis]|uniref:procollagen-lysine 5-dioxygenase n=1 Tax=Moumouvirus australiensis TaxID=2109587 RepID=A0A2P1EL82_9VIRU|nr:putative procollagen-lysine [Moumouvirus australiensis]AVL94651.1 putative procollagen-lysine [Moumouvirus australiensis]
MIHKAYVINLERRNDKKQHMISEFNKLNEIEKILDYEFFNAVDGTNIERLNEYKFKIPNWFDPNSGKAMTNGEVGCALSHYSVWKEIVSNIELGLFPKDSRILILEDDVIFVDNFLEKFKIYENEINCSYDMFYLHRKALNFDGEEKVSIHIRKPKKSYWTCAYILTYSGAKKLINSNYLDNLIPVDEFLPIMYGCNIYGFEKLFESCEKLNCYAAYPSLLKLTGNAFNDSETFHSKSYMVPNKFTFDTDKEFIVLYIGPTKGDSFKRFIEYCDLYTLPKIILDNTSQSDILILNKQLAQIENLPTKFIMVISVAENDYCNIIPVAPPTEIINKFNNNIKNKENILISLNSGKSNKILFCGWGNTIQKMLQNYLDKIDINNTNIKTNISTAIVFNSFISGDIIKDEHCQIFCGLDLEKDITYNTTKSRITYNKTGTIPCVFYSSEISNLILNRIQNYTGNNWNEYYGYKNMSESLLTYPTIYLSFKVGKNPSITDIIEKLEYPKELLTINIENGSTGDLFYQQDIVKFLNSKCEYYFFINHDCVIVNPKTLKELLELGKKVIAPLVRKGTESWSNFWGDLSETGYYNRSHDYFDILNGERRGCWNVPYISGVYLIHRSVLELVPNIFSDNEKIDVDMRMCHNLRQADVHIYVSNINSYGFIQEEIKIEPGIDLSKPVTIYDFFTRRDEWERKYLHPEYFLNKNNLKNLRCPELCNDAYNFPLFSKDFCSELIQIMENYGKWSGGTGHHIDHRLGNNYYENVPTQDIQLFEVGLDKHWETIVADYISPLVKIIYGNYKTKGVHLAFVVRYHWQLQNELQEHHDASTYTINVALNECGKDYEGGGCEFIRQKYISRNQEVGTSNIHPGRLTHLHKGLKTTNGTRYILVSFIN